MPKQHDAPKPDGPLPIASETAVQTIPLAGPVASAEAELSGLAWWNDWLILLPQYPSRVGTSLHALPKADILAYLDGELDAPLTPQAIPLTVNGTVAGFEGFEAIGFIDDTIFVTIESRIGLAMLGYLAQGELAPNLSAARIDLSIARPILPQSDLNNYTDETLLIYEDTVITLYEANGQNVNEEPHGHRFASDLSSMPTVPFPHIEYRITDATAPDAQGRFWAINYTPPMSIEKLNPAVDPLISQHGLGATHASQNVVERLVEFQYQPDGIRLTDRAPLPLQLLGDDQARNWEGIARLDQRGFLLVTDKFPETILGFVAGSE